MCVCFERRFSGQQPLWQTHLTLDAYSRARTFGRDTTRNARAYVQPVLCDAWGRRPLAFPVSHNIPRLYVRLCANLQPCHVHHIPRAAIAQGFHLCITTHPSTRQGATIDRRGRALLLYSTRPLALIRYSKSACCTFPRIHALCIVTSTEHAAVPRCCHTRS